ncbi:MAG: universal stress protein [Thermodesulfobacteria bacterium]|nr:universal stress protein [Thermodesulfobacteriota bacterium]
MNVKIEKIGVGLDGSTSSYRALKEVLDLAKKLGAEIVGIHVLPIPVDLAELGAAVIELEAELRKEAEAILARGEEEAQKAGVPYKGVILEGEIAESIASYAERENLDLLAVGYQGKSKISELIIGSVTSKLLGISKVPLLVIK